VSKAHSEREDGAHESTQHVLPELRERAVRIVFEHTGEYPSQWATIRSAAEKIGCVNEVLRRCVRQVDSLLAV
jgi:transposase-like protein